MYGVAALLALQASLPLPALQAGTVARRGSGPPAPPPIVVRLPTARTAEAVRAKRPPVIDGRENDPVWRIAPPITQFHQWKPVPDTTPTFRTVAKVAYDAANLYVFVRAYDPHPDSIIRILARRDTWTPSDMIWLFLDPYHDRRTGYEFGVNAAGVKIDQAIYHDGNEDNAWNAVWKVATRVDSLGWTAEFRIPMSQLRYGPAREHTFGIAIDRDIYRLSERDAWPLFSQAKAGLVSQFGDLTGLRDLEAPRRLEASPYLVAKDASTIKDNAFARSAEVTAGADLQYRVASNLTLHATVNPDFGEVEADPSVLNLSAFETFFSERRPFFVAGSGLFDFRVNCNAVSCGPDQLFYSRRIGRPPQLWGTYGDTTPAQPTTIVGAAKLTGRLPGGLTLGVLDGVTARARLGADTTVEPATNYAVVRVQQDLRRGETSFGGMVTAVDRSMDAFTTPYLARSAYVGGVDFRHRFLHATYEISGSVAGSSVQGSAAALAGIQTDAVHYYQRPDAGLPLDSSRTVLGGDAESLNFTKVAGRHVEFETSYDRTSPGFEINDLGFLRRADQQSWATWVGLFDRNPGPLYNEARLHLHWQQLWTARGLPNNRQVSASLQLTLRNNMNVSLNGSWGQLGTTFDDRSARGGPAVRQNPFGTASFGITGDDRRAVLPSFSVSWFKGDAGHNWHFGVSPAINVRVASRFTASAALSVSRDVSDNQWYGNYTDSVSVTHYVFAHLDQRTAVVTLRLNYTFTPNVSLQIYAQPYISKGTYSDVRQLSATPRAPEYVDRYATYGDTSVTNHPGGFDFTAFRSNVVFRWEWRPGSTLYVVWNEGRQGSTDYAGGGSYGADLRTLFGLHPANTFLVKWSYWINP